MLKAGKLMGSRTIPNSDLPLSGIKVAEFIHMIMGLATRLILAALVSKPRVNFTRFHGVFVAQVRSTATWISG